MKVDGVDYTVNFTKFKVGASFFIPCIHPDIAKKNIRGRMKRLRFKVGMKFVIEEGLRGIRVWRLK